MPALQEANKQYKKTLEAKDEENKKLMESLAQMEKRFKSGAKEAHKFTAKQILKALELKSLNERGDYLLKQAKATMRNIKTTREWGE